MARVVHIAALTATAVLAGCLLTPALRRWHDPGRVPDIEETEVQCVVRGVLPDDDGRLRVAFAPLSGDRVPAHLVRATEDAPMWIDAHRRPDLPAARLEGFDVQRRQVAAFDGEHLRRATLNLRIVDEGVVDATVLGREVSAAEVPARLRAGELDRSGLLRGGAVERALAGLDAHRWLELVGDPPVNGTVRQEAVAWLDPSGVELHSTELRTLLLSEAEADRARACTLLARCTQIGREDRFVRIPLPVLLNGETLELRRRGAEVSFAHTTRWIGELTEPRPVPRRAVAALDTFAPHMSYHWIDEHSTAEPLKEILIAVLTPVTAVIDFVLMANPTIRSLYMALRTVFPRLPALPSGGQ